MGLFKSSCFTVSAGLGSGQGCSQGGVAYAFYRSSAGALPGLIFDNSLVNLACQAYRSLYFTVVPGLAFAGTVCFTVSAGLGLGQGVPQRKVAAQGRPPQEPRAQGETPHFRGLGV